MQAACVGRWWRGGGGGGGGGGPVEGLKGSVVLLQPTKDKRQLGMSQGQSCQDCFLLFHST